MRSCRTDRRRRFDAGVTTAAGKAEHLETMAPATGLPAAGRGHGRTRSNDQMSALPGVSSSEPGAGVVASFARTVPVALSMSQMGGS